MVAVASVKHCIDKGTVLLFPSPLIHENTGDRNKRTVPLNYTGHYTTQIGVFITGGIGAMNSRVMNSSDELRCRRLRTFM